MKRTPELPSRNAPDRSIPEGFFSEEDSRPALRSSGSSQTAPDKQLQLRTPSARPRKKALMPRNERGSLPVSLKNAFSQDTFLPAGEREPKPTRARIPPCKGKGAGVFQEAEGLAHKACSARRIPSAAGKGSASSSPDQGDYGRGSQGPHTWGSEATRVPLLLHRLVRPARLPTASKLKKEGEPCGSSP